MRAPTQSGYKSPILTTIFNVLGAIVLAGTVIMVILGFLVVGVAEKSPAVLFPINATAVLAVLTAVVYFGIAQVIDYLGRTAYSTDRLCTLLETSVFSQLKSIENRLTSHVPFPVRIDAPPPPTRPEAVYHYSADGSQQGPLTATDLRDMRAAGLITDDTPVLRDGESQWRSYHEFLALTRS